MIVWMTASFLTFGMPYLQWAWGFDLVTRFNSGGWSSASNFQYHWQFYAVIAQQGMAFLWPLIPLSFLLWLREGAHEFWRGRFDATSVIGSSFLVYYLVFILFLIATLINYSLPLTPLAVLSLAFLFRFVEESRVVLAATVALLLAILNGLTGDL